MSTGNTLNWRPAENRSLRTAQRDETSAPENFEDVQIDSSFLLGSLSSVFDEAFDVYKKNFLSIFLMVSVVFLPLEILLHGLVNSWLVPLIHAGDAAQTPDIMNGLTLVFGFLFTGVPQYAVPGLAALLCMTLLSGPVCIYISRIYHGKPAVLRDAFRACRRYYMKLIISWSITALGFIGIVVTSLVVISILFTVIAIAFRGNLPDIAAILMLLLMILVPYLCGSAMAARWYLFTTPLIVLEGQPVTKIPVRNNQLIERSLFRQSWLAALSLPLITYGLLLLLLFSIDSITNLLHLTAGAEYVVQIALSTFIFLFFQPYWMIFLTLLYFNYRAKNEALDIYRLAEELPQYEFRESAPVNSVYPSLRVPPVLPSLPVITHAPQTSMLNNAVRISPYVIPPMPQSSESPAVSKDQSILEQAEEKTD